jgi:hypothetical protein
MAAAGAAAASVGVFRCCSHEADAPREAALLEALAQHDVAAATTDLDAIRLDFADGAAPAGQAFYALYSAASARSIATYARGRRPPHRCPAIRGRRLSSTARVAGAVRPPWWSGCFHAPATRRRAARNERSSYRAFVRCSSAGASWAVTPLSARQASLRRALSRC